MMQVCRVHGGDPLPLSEFYPDASQTSGHQSLCKECSKADSKRRYRARVEASWKTPQTTPAPEGMKVCRKHGGDALPLSAFPHDRTARDGHKARCKACCNAAAVESRLRAAAKEDDDYEPRSGGPYVGWWNREPRGDEEFALELEKRRARGPQFCALCNAKMRSTTDDKRCESCRRKQRDRERGALAG